MYACVQLAEGDPEYNILQSFKTLKNEFMKNKNKSILAMLNPMLQRVNASGKEGGYMNGVDGVLRGLQPCFFRMDLI